jgi:hypothetical protein
MAVLISEAVSGGCDTVAAKRSTVANWIERPIILRQEVELRPDAPPPEDVARELEARLRALPYVLEATWSAEVEVEKDELGRDRFLRGRVLMVPLEQLPEDDPDLNRYRECFQIPGVLGPRGPMPLTPSQQADYAAQEFDRVDQEQRIRRAIEEDERVQAAFFTANPDVFARQGWVLRPALTPTDIELSVALNMLWEDLDWAAYREISRAGQERTEYEHGHEAGLHSARLMVNNEITRRGLGFVARCAPWPF